VPGKQKASFAIASVWKKRNTLWLVLILPFALFQLKKESPEWQG
jgi:hypothetical protein